MLRANSNDNTLMVTALCNNRCLICSQPPVEDNDIDIWFERNLMELDAAPDDLDNIGLSGGEPTMAGGRLFELISRIRLKYPAATIQLLTNGRRFSDLEFLNMSRTIEWNNLNFAIPLHSDNSIDHDYIAGVPEAFSETIRGLYHLAQYNANIELRIPVHRLNYHRLPEIAHYIFFNLPFAMHVAFMGLENTGYAVVNRREIDIDPAEYQTELEDAITFLAGWGMNVSIFNIPLCLLTKMLQPYARKSISDWKKINISTCADCACMDSCCGIFKTSEWISAKLSPIKLNSLISRGGDQSYPR